MTDILQSIATIILSLSIMGVGAGLLLHLRWHDEHDNSGQDHEDNPGW